MDSQLVSCFVIRTLGSRCSMAKRARVVRISHAEPYCDANRRNRSCLGTQVWGAEDQVCYAYTRRLECVRPLTLLPTYWSGVGSGHYADPKFQKPPQPYTGRIRS